MDIIKHGQKPDYKKQFERPHCGCQFIADAGEYKWREGEYNTVELVCRCPECAEMCYRYRR